MEEVKLSLDDLRYIRNTLVEASSEGVIKDYNTFKQVTLKVDFLINKEYKESLNLEHDALEFEELYEYLKDKALEKAIPLEEIIGKIDARIKDDELDELYNALGKFIEANEEV